MPRGWSGPKPPWWKKLISDKLTGVPKPGGHGEAVADARRGRKFPRNKKEGEGDDGQTDKDKPKPTW